MAQGMRWGEELWLDQDLGFSDRRRGAGKQPGSIEEAMRLFGTSSAAPHPEGNPMEFNPVRTGIPGSTPTPVSKIAAPAGGGSLPEEKWDQPEYTGKAPYHMTPSPERDPTTGLLRIPTSRSDLIQDVRGGERSYFNPHTGTNYPSILEALWGGVKKPAKERITATAGLEEAKVGQGGMEGLIAEMQKRLAALDAPTGETPTTPGRDVATPGLGAEAATPEAPTLPSYYEGLEAQESGYKGAAGPASRLLNWLSRGRELEEFSY